MIRFKITCRASDLSPYMKWIISKIARESASLTQEQAMELIGVSISSLSGYERGETVPNDNTVLKMICNYESVWLGYEHLRKSKVGQTILPKINISGVHDLAKSVPTLQKEVADVTRINSEIVKIACDGVVDIHEEEEWIGIEKELDEMAGATLTLLLGSYKEKSPSERELQRA